MQSRARFDVRSKRRCNVAHGWRHLAAILTCGTLASTPSLLAEVQRSGDYSYVITNGSVTITGYNGAGAEVEIPNNIQGKSVRVVEECAFRRCTNITHLVIPDSVSVLKEGAFAGCHGMTNCVVGNGVTSIEWETFLNCRRLQSVRLGNGVTNIGDSAFKNCRSLISMTLPSNVVSLGEEVFSGCDSLATVFFAGPPPRASGDDRKLFSSRVSLYYRNGVPGWWDVKSNRAKMYGYREAKLASSDQRFSYVIDKSNETATITSWIDRQGSVEIPAVVDGVRVVGVAGSICRDGSGNLTPESNWPASVSVPDSVNSIASGAFSGTRIASVTLGNGLITIDKAVFAGCGRLTNLVIGANVLSIGRAAFRDCGSLASIRIPDSVVDIADEAFSGCANVEKLAIGRSVARMGHRAFWGAHRLESIDIPDSVREIGNEAFAGLRSVKSVKLGSGVISVGNLAFAGLSGIRDVSLPGGLTSLGWRPFGACSNLTEIFVAEASANYRSVDGMLYDKQLTRVIACPEGRSGTVVIPDGVSRIGESAFQDCRGLLNVVLPESVTSIGTRAFSGCSSLKQVNIPSRVTSIGWDVFLGCSNLTAQIREAASAMSALNAQSSVILSEIISVPYPSTDPVQIELLNKGSNSVNMTGCRLRDAKGHVYSLPDLPPMPPGALIVVRFGTPTNGVAEEVLSFTNNTAWLWCRADWANQAFRGFANECALYTAGGFESDFLMDFAKWGYDEPSIAYYQAVNRGIGGLVRVRSNALGRSFHHRGSSFIKLWISKKEGDREENWIVVNGAEASIGVRNIFPVPMGESRVEGRRVTCFWWTYREWGVCRLQIALDEEFAHVVVDQREDVNGVNDGTGFIQMDAGRYYWRVRDETDTPAGQWSEVKQFSVK